MDEFNDLPLEIGRLYKYKSEIPWGLFTINNWEVDDLERPGHTNNNIHIRNLRPGTLVLVLDQKWVICKDRYFLAVKILFYSEIAVFYFGLSCKESTFSETKEKFKLVL